MAWARIKDFFLSFFNRKERRLYAVLHGRTAGGEYLVQVERNETEVICFTPVEKRIRKIPVKDFDLGLKNKVLEIAGVLPPSVYNVCIADYNNTKTKPHANTSNRRKQHSPQGPLGGERVRESTG